MPCFRAPHRPAEPGIGAGERYKFEIGYRDACEMLAAGAPREGYFEGLVELAEGRWTPTHDELQEFLEKHDNIYV